MGNAEIANILKEEIGNKSIKLPKSIIFNLKENKLIVTIGNITQNMQSNESAFEGWIICLKRRFFETIRSVDIEWELKTNVVIDYENPSNECLHYFRFLYRMDNFLKMFDWINLISNRNLEDLKTFKSNISSGLIMNYPLSKKTESISESKKEDKIESLFVNKSNNILKSKLNIDVLDQQLPVGIFKEKISKSTTFLNRGKSAIDLWGIRNQDNSLHIFELKYVNKMVGIISELLFYLCIINEVFVSEKGIIKYPPLNEVPECRSFKSLYSKKFNSLIGYFLVDSIHPLIDEKVIALINEGLCKLGEINVKFLEYKYNPLENTLEWK